MITLDDALKNTEFWHMTMKNADGTPMRCRKNGGTKTWKKWPGLFRMPVKAGLRECFYIQNFDPRDADVPAAGKDQPRNDDAWCTPERWPAEHVLFAGVETRVTSAASARETVRRQQLVKARRAYEQSPTPALAACIKLLEVGYA